MTAVRTLPGWLALSILALAAIGVTDGAWRAAMGLGIGEGSPVELASALGYAVALAAVLSSPARPERWVAAAVILAAMGLRELDFDKRFTEVGLLKSSLYLGDHPLWLKLLGGAVIAVILAALARLAGAIPAWLRALRAGEAWAVLLAGGLAAIPAAKALDGLGRKLADVGLSISAEANARAAYLEETVEVAIPLLLAASAALLGRRAR